MAIPRIMLTIEYDGTNYSGWQAQENAPSIQCEIEHALRKLTGVTIRVTGASRTDAGVHALGQRAHFDASLSIPTHKIPLAINTKLPRDIRVTHAETVDGIHARFDARRKIYRYQYYTRTHANPLCRNMWHIPRELDIALMKEEARQMIGIHDFAAFRASGHSSKTSVREVFSCELSRCPIDNNVINLYISGNGFLYNMVRILAGTLADVSSGLVERGAVARSLESLSRLSLGQTAPPNGLTLMNVYYEEDNHE